MAAQNAKLESDLKSQFSAAHPELSTAKLHYPDEFLSRFRLIPNAESIQIEYRSFLPKKGTGAETETVPIVALFEVTSASSFLGGPGFDSRRMSGVGAMEAKLLSGAGTNGEACWLISS